MVINCINDISVLLTTAYGTAYSWLTKLAKFNTICSPAVVNITLPFSAEKIFLKEIPLLGLVKSIPEVPNTEQSPVLGQFSLSSPGGHTAAPPSIAFATLIKFGAASGQ